MPEKKYYSPHEAIEYLNKKFDLDPPMDSARLARLRRNGRIHGEKIGTRGSVYTKKALDMATLADIQDKRKIRYKVLDKLTTS